MAECKSSGNYALNLIIIGVAIIIVILAQQNLANGGSDSFVGKVPMTSIGNGPYYGAYYGLPPGVIPTGQPMMYPYQLYPAKMPYYDDSVNNIGRPCKEPNGCGALGACQNGICSIKDDVGSTTVFDLKI